MTDRAGLRAALAAAEEQFGSIDVLDFSPGPTASDFAERPAVDASALTVESIVPEIEMTLYGGVTAIGQVLPGMLERGSGTILVSAGSGAGPMVIPGVANYNVATEGRPARGLRVREGLDAVHRQLTTRHAPITARPASAEPRRM